MRPISSSIRCGDGNRPLRNPTALAVGGCQVQEIGFRRKLETKLSNRNFRKDLDELIRSSTNGLIRKDFLGKGFECSGPFMHIVNYYVEDATNQFDTILLNLYEDCNLKNIF